LAIHLCDDVLQIVFTRARCSGVSDRLRIFTACGSICCLSVCGCCAILGSSVVSTATVTLFAGGRIATTGFICCLVLRSLNCFLSSLIAGTTDNPETE
jgi:hypothetical protein